MYRYLTNILKDNCSNNADKQCRQPTIRISRQYSWQYRRMYYKGMKNIFFKNRTIWMGNSLTIYILVLQRSNWLVKQLCKWNNQWRRQKLRFRRLGYVPRSDSKYRQHLRTHHWIRYDRGSLWPKWRPEISRVNILFNTLYR